MILAVTAGKGGVGKSTIALNLADALGAVVVDADLAMADLPAGRGPDLHDVLAERADPLEAIRQAGPVSILPCGRSLAGARAVDPTALSGILEAVEHEYGRVVVDTPAGLHSDAGLPVVAATAILVVTRPTEPALADAIRAREFARTVGTPLAQVVVNRAPDGMSTDPVASALGAPVTTLPDSEQIAAAQQAGRPVAAVAPDSDAARRFDDLAAAVQSALSSS